MTALQEARPLHSRYTFRYKEACESVWCDTVTFLSHCFGATAGPLPAPAAMASEVRPAPETAPTAAPACTRAGMVRDTVLWGCRLGGAGLQAGCYGAAGWVAWGCRLGAMGLQAGWRGAAWGGVGWRGLAWGGSQVTWAGVGW